MGYGRDGRMTPLKGSGDGGLDGVIDRDELGLSKIYDIRLRKTKGRPRPGLTAAPISRSVAGDERPSGRKQIVENGRRFRTALPRRP